MEDYIVSDPAITSATNIYELFKVNVCPVETKKVPDLLTGGDRKRKFGVALSIALIPTYQQLPEPISIPQDMGAMLIDGDSLDDIKARIVAEVEMIFKAYQDMEDANNKTSGDS